MLSALPVVLLAAFNLPVAPEGHAETGTVSAAAYAGYQLDDPPPANRLYLQSITALRANPLGLLELLTLSYRSRIMKSEKPPYQDNFAGAGLMPLIRATTRTALWPKSMARSAAPSIRA